MSGNDAMDGSQAQPCALPVVFGGKEWFEEALAGFRAHAASVVPNREQDAGKRGLGH